MATRNYQNVAYSLNQSPLTTMAPSAIVARRTPTTADTGFPIGQLWVDSLTNNYYVLTSIVSNSATWTSVSNAGGIFASITVTTGPNDIEGTTTINTAGAATTSIGSSNAASGIAMLVGTGNFTLGGVATSTYTIGTGTVGGTILIGGTGQTGTITLGSSTGTNVVNVGTGTGATTVNIATGVTNAKTIDIGTGAAMANTINIGGTGANVIAIGNTQTAGSVSIGNAMTTGSVTVKAGSGGLVLTPTLGNISIAPDVSTLQTTITPTLNARLGSILVDGTAVATKIATATSLTFAITNSTILATSIVLATVTSTEAIANVVLTVLGIQVSASTLSITIHNNGGSDTAGNYNINFFVLN